MTASPTIGDGAGSGGDTGPAPVAVRDRAGDALARCIACPPREFFDGYWGTRPLLTRAVELGAVGSAAGFEDLLDADAVDVLTSSHALRTPFLRMAQDGAVLPAARFTRGGGAGATVTDQVADDKVTAAMADGATLVLQALHRSWPPLVRFGSQLAHQLGHPVQINSYITPPQNQGFSAHYDVHDVFVLQVAGRKHWTIHAPVLESPLATQPWDQRKDDIAARVRDEPLIDAVLEPGDALYLPRGTVHSAAALGETSIHLTVGIHPVTRHHLVEHLLALVAEDDALRASLPAGVDLADPAVLAEHLSSTVAALTRALDAVEPADVARRVGTDLMRRTRPEPIAPLAQLRAADAVGLHTPVQLRPGLRHRLEPTGDAENSVGIVLLDRTVTVPAHAADAVKLLLSGASVTPGELTVGGPDASDDDDRIGLVRRLLREGVVVPA